MLRPQAGHAYRAENRTQRETLSSSGSRRDPHPGAFAQTGQGQHIQRHTHVRIVFVPQPHLHHIRAVVHELVRVDQEEQIRRLLATTRTQIHTLHTAVSGRVDQKQDHSL